MSITKNQKQSLLDQLNGYLTGNDNAKRVMNSPAIDRNGKMLSYDGQKVFNSSNRGRNNRRGGPYNRRDDRRSGQNQTSGGNDRGNNRNQRGGRSNKNSVIYTLSNFEYFIR